MRLRVRTSSASVGAPPGITALGIAAVLFASGIASWSQSAHKTSDSRHSPVARPAREEIVPTQDLSLTDGAGTPLGRLDVSDGLITLHLYTSAGGYALAAVYRDRDTVYLSFGGSEEGTSISVDPNQITVSVLKRGAILGGWSDPSNSPSKGKRFDDDLVIPSEDVHLMDRRGWVFASLGLAANGDPGIALADARGTVRVAWFERRLLGNAASDGWHVAVFDKAGVMRLSLELRPEEPPDLVFYLDDLSTQFVLDFGSHRLTPKSDAHPSLAAWLPSMQTRPRGKMHVVDSRGRMLWSTP